MASIMKGLVLLLLFCLKATIVTHPWLIIVFLDMRVTIVYEDVRIALDVKPDDTVAGLKRMFNGKLVVETTEDKKVGKYLELKFGGKFAQKSYTITIFVLPLEHHRIPSKFCIFCPVI